MTRSRYVSLILILGGLTALTPFSIDMYLPGFPAIAKDLSTSAAKVSLSLSSFFIGISLGQLLYGPSARSFRKKKTTLHRTLGIYCWLPLVVHLFIPSVGLIGLRVIQALGSCAATVASVTFVRDLFPVEENAKVFALLILVLGASPMIAPTAGGYIISSYGWHAVFIVLTLICVLIFVCCIFWLPAGNAPDLERSLKARAHYKKFSFSIHQSSVLYLLFNRKSGVYRLVRLCSGFTGCIHECFRRIPENLWLDLRDAFYWFHRLQSAE